MNKLSVKLDEFKELLGFLKKRDKPELSLIELKKNEKSTNGSGKKTNIQEFFVSTAKNLIYVILWWLIGANFIFFMYSDLDACFPTDREKAPYVPYGKSGMFNFMESIKMSELRKRWEDYFNQLKQNNSCDKKETSSTNKETNEPISGKDATIYSCGEHDKMIKETNSNQKIKKKLGFNEPSFPYTWNNSSMFKKFFGRSAQYSYIVNRKFLKGRMKTFSELGKTTKIGELLIFLLGFPLIYITFLFQIPLIAGFITTSFGEIIEGGLFMTILGIFAGNITFIYPVLIGMIQSFQLLLKFTIMPSVINSGAIWKIMKCKIPVMFAIFSGLTIYSAFMHLETMGSIVVSGILALLSIVVIYRLRGNLFRSVIENE